MTDLEKEVERLKIKLETLIDYLNTAGTRPFGPPDGRSPYDVKVDQKLAEANLLP
jgi:hypothetical protein